MPSRFAVTELLPDLAAPGGGPGASFTGLPRKPFAEFSASAGEGTNASVAEPAPKAADSRAHAAEGEAAGDISGTTIVESSGDTADDTADADAADATPGKSYGNATGDATRARPASAEADAAAREAARLLLLRRVGILDTLPEQVFDDIVMLASSICGTPIAAVSLIDEHRQWFKARRGLEVDQTERSAAFCAHAIEDPDALFIVEDAHADDRFRANPLVTGDPKIRFYAGAPIRMPGGEALGTVCVIDTEPRSLDTAQRRALAALSRQTTALLSLRLETKLAEERSLQLAQQTEHARIERRRSGEMLEMVLRGGNLGFWDLELPTGRFRANEREYEIVGRSAEASGPALEWRSLVHPDDWAVLGTAIGPHLAGETESYGCEHRMRHLDGHWVWVQSRAVIVDRRSDGSPRRIVGTHMDISERVDSLQSLRKASTLLERMGSMARVGGWEFEVASGKITWTDEVYAIHDLDRSTDPRLVDALSHYPSPGRQTLERAIDRAIRRGVAYDLELPFVSANGRELQVRAQGEAVTVDGAVVRLVGAFQDITAQKATELAAVESRRQLRLITDNVPALIAYVDAEQRYRFINATMREVLGPMSHGAIGKTIVEVRGERAHANARRHIEAALRGEKAEFTYSDDRPGRLLRLQSTYVPDIDSAGQVRGFYSMTIDITELWESQRRLEALARIDPLTGLPNRRQLDERIEEAMLRSRRSGATLAVMFLDVDRFKSINDSCGHAGGDSVLCEFARRLQRCVRLTDTVARVSGDEFVVLAEAAGTENDVAALGRKIVDAMQAPFTVDGRALEVTSSIGIAVWRGDDGATAGELLARADGALYTVKRNGRNAFEIAAAD